MRGSARVLSLFRKEETVFLSIPSPSVRIALTTCLLGAIVAGAAHGAAGRPATRSMAEISQEALVLNQNLAKQHLFTVYADLATVEGRTKFAGAKEPLLKLAALLDEMSEAKDAPVAMGTPGMARMLTQGQRMMRLAMASSLGNDKATKLLATLAGGADKDLAPGARMGQFMAAWLLANKDEPAEGKILEGIEALAKDNPANNVLPGMLYTIRGLPGLPEGLAKRIDAIFMDTLTGRAAKGIQSDIAAKAKKKDGGGQ